MALYWGVLLHKCLISWYTPPDTQASGDLVFRCPLHIAMIQSLNICWISKIFSDLISPILKMHKLLLRCMFFYYTTRSNTLLFILLWVLMLGRSWPAVINVKMGRCYEPTDVRAIWLLSVCMWLAWSPFPRSIRCHSCLDNCRNSTNVLRLLRDRSLFMEWATGGKWWLA